MTMDIIHRIGNNAVLCAIAIAVAPVGWWSTGGPGTLVFRRQRSETKFQWRHFKRGLQVQVGYVKIGVCQTKSCYLRNGCIPSKVPLALMDLDPHNTWLQYIQQINGVKVPLRH